MVRVVPRSASLHVWWSHQQSCTVLAVVVLGHTNAAVVVATALYRRFRQVFGPAFMAGSALVLAAGVGDLSNMWQG